MKKLVFTMMLLITFAPVASAWPTFSIDSFLGLRDTPNNYTGEGANCVAVNATETALEFVSCGSGGGHTIQDEGSDLTDRANLNFTGAGITCTDDAGNDATDCDVPAGSGGGWTDDGTTVRLTASTDNVSIGADAEPSTQKLQVTGDTFTTGEFIEQTGSSGTGDTVVNNSLIFVPSADTSITAGGGITVTNSLMRVQGSGGAVDITANPQIAAGTDGEIVIIQGVSDVNTVKLDDGTGLALCGGVSMTLGNNDNISFMYDSGETEWLEWGGRCDLN